LVTPAPDSRRVQPGGASASLREPRQSTSGIGDERCTPFSGSGNRWRRPMALERRPWLVEALPDPCELDQGVIDHLVEPSHVAPVRRVEAPTGADETPGVVLKRRERRCARSRTGAGPKLHALLAALRLADQPRPRAFARWRDAAPCAALGKGGARAPESRRLRPAAVSRVPRATAGRNPCGCALRGIPRPDPGTSSVAPWAASIARAMRGPHRVARTRVGIATRGWPVAREGRHEPCQDTHHG
jgi:hypothetical protein